MSEYQDYPHMLYKGGQVGPDCLVVDNAGEEAHARSEGYARASAADDQPADAPRRGRPKKAG